MIKSLGLLISLLLILRDFHLNNFYQKYGMNETDYFLILQIKVFLFVIIK